MKRLIVLSIAVVLLCGFSYKNNPQTGKPDLVTTSVADLTDISTAYTPLTTFKNYTSVDRLTANQTITLSGDATGSGSTAITMNVGKINGDVVDNAARSTGDFIRYDGSQWRHVPLVSGDIPNNAANTTGSAAKLTTARTINGVSFDGTANIQTATANTSDYIQGTKDTAFTITASGLTVIGGTGVTYKRNYTQVGNIISFRLEIDPNGGTTASTANTTYFSINMPAATYYGACSAVNATTVTSYGAGMVIGTFIYPPTWAATSGTIVISGTYLAI